MSDAPCGNTKRSEIRLPTPPAADTRQYLGLPAGEYFTVGQIAAEVVIVQVYSMYCPHCQREAPRVNELYALIQKQAGLHRRVRLIGVGACQCRYQIGNRGSSGPRRERPYAYLPWRKDCSNERTGNRMHL